MFYVIKNFDTGLYPGFLDGTQYTSHADAVAAIDTEAKTGWSLTGYWRVEEYKS